MSGLFYTILCPKLTQYFHRFHDYLEERDGGMPFLINQKFKLAIAFAKDHFKFAVNGEYIKDFDFKYRPDGVLPHLNGFKIDNEEMRVEVAEVEHHHCTSSNCDKFEKYSVPTSGGEYFQEEMKILKQGADRAKC